MKKVITFILLVAMVLGTAAFPGYAAGVEPKITSTSIADGAVGVSPVDAKIKVTFNTDINMKTINTSTITSNPTAIVSIKPEGTKSVTLYLDKMALGTEYTITFTNQIKSADGAAMTQRDISFTTMDDPPQYRQITNGDFEDSGWGKAVFFDGASLANTAIETENGNTYAKLTLGWNDAPLCQKVYVEAGKTYEVRARVKSSITQSVSFTQYHTVDGTNKIATVGAGEVQAGEWTDVSAKISVAEGSGSDYADIRIAAANEKSELCIDDFQFYEEGCDEEPPRVDTGSEEVKTVTKIENSADDKTKQLLSGLGFYANNEYVNEKQKVSKDDFAKYIAVLLGSADNKMTANAVSKYSDIEEGYNGYAGVTADSEIILPDENGCFNPADEILYTEAARALVVALGYKYMLENDSPVIAASRLGLTSGVSLKEHDKLDYKNLNALLKNAIKADTLVMNFSDKASMSPKPVMSNNLKLEEGKGIVTATRVASLTGGDGVQDGYLEIDGTAYKILSCNADALLGNKVKFYYKEIDDEDTIIYICDVEKYNEAITIDAWDVVKFENGTYFYTDENDKMKRMEVEADKKLVYNGRSVTSYPLDLLKPANGFVTLIDNNGNGKADIISIREYQTFVVKSIDSNNGIVYDKYEDKSIEIDLSKDVQIYKDGKSKNFKGIVVGDILSIEQSYDKDRTVIYIGSETITGNVGKIDKEEYIVAFYDIVHGREITRDYKYLYNYGGTSGIENGTDGTFYCDYYGNIVAYTKSQGTWKFGYFISSKIVDEGSEYVRIELYTENNKKEKLAAADKVKINNTTYKDVYRINEELPQSPELIKYRLDSAGNVRYVEKVGTDKSGLRKIEEGSGDYNLPQQILGQKVYFTNETVLFIVPKIGEENTGVFYYDLANKYFWNNYGYSFTAYSSKDSDLEAEAVVMYDRPVRDSDDKSFGVVDTISTGLNEDDEVVYEVGVHTMYGKTKLKMKPEIFEAVSPAIGKGDFITWLVRMDEETTNVSVLYKGNSHKLLAASNPSHQSLNNAPRTFFGKVTKKEGSYIRVENNGTSELYNTSKFGKIYKYSSDANTLEAISAAQIIENVSEIMVVIRSTNPVMMVVYE